MTFIASPTASCVSHLRVAKTPESHMRVISFAGIIANRHPRQYSGYRIKPSCYTSQNLRQWKLQVIKILNELDQMSLYPGAKTDFIIEILKVNPGYKKILSELKNSSCDIRILYVNYKPEMGVCGTIEIGAIINCSVGYPLRTHFKI